MERPNLSQSQLLTVLSVWTSEDRGNIAMDSRAKAVRFSFRDNIYGLVVLKSSQTSARSWIWCVRSFGTHSGCGTCMKGGRDILCSGDSLRRIFRAPCSANAGHHLLEWSGREITACSFSVTWHCSSAGSCCMCAWEFNAERSISLCIGPNIWWRSCVGLPSSLQAASTPVINFSFDVYGGSPVA